MDSGTTIPKVQIQHLYQGLLCTGAVFILYAIDGYAATSKDRRAAAQQITTGYEESYRKDTALQLSILQADSSKGGKVQGDLHEYSMRRQAEVSTERRAKLKENTASHLKVLAYYRGVLWAGIVLAVSGIGLWYWLVQRHRDQIIRMEARRAERKARRKKKPMARKKLRLKKAKELVPAAA